MASLPAPGAPGVLEGLGLHGYGHFTTVRVDADGTVRGLARHLARLRAGSEELFGAELDVAQVRVQLAKHVAALGPDRLPRTVRVTLTPASLDIGALDGVLRPVVVVTDRPAPGVPAAGLRVSTAEHERHLPHLKHTGLLPLWHLRRLAQQGGADDALLVDRRGRVAEGTTWSLLLVRDDELVVPDAPALPGITRALVLEAAARLGVAVRREAVRAADLPAYDGALATAATWGVRPVVAVDGQPLGVTELGVALAAAYEAEVGEPVDPSTAPAHDR